MPYSNPQDYTVGWICAPDTEYVAAQAFLDTRDDPPESVAINDNNNYTLGTIGRHKVVIAVLPDGEYGIASAAGVARDMLHSFQNVRIGLVVGIGGGAPTRENGMRLGDIVVSTPRDGRGGVMQYDFGKIIQNKGFQRTGFLDQPPTLLRGAISGLKAQYEIYGHNIDKAINHALKRRERLQGKYDRPDGNSDRLYQSDFVHSNPEATCSEVCGDDPSQLVTRDARTEEDDCPAIHYGLIASANSPMKDASIRDSFAKKEGVLCFEMKAAGLMNHFPCLVICGICDYSDSHKNKDWQGYAAMAAAAYAKELLCQIHPTRVEAEKKISAILHDGAPPRYTSKYTTHSA